VESNQIRCYQSPRNFVVEQGRKDRVGNDFLIKFKAEADESLSCTYVLGNNGFQINEWAAYFSDLKDDLLIFECYTGPGPHLLSIWDLKKRQKVFEDSCSDAVYRDDSILYWLETGNASQDNNLDLISNRICLVFETCRSRINYKN